MQFKNGDWYSGFCETFKVTANRSVVSICSGDSSSEANSGSSGPSADFGGGHSVIFLEEVETRSGDAAVIKIDLVTPGHGDVIVRIEEKERNGVQTGKYAVDGTAYARKMFSVPHGKGRNLIVAARRFRAKAEDGRYRYRLPGGVLGRMLTWPGQRGVNCADFAIKILAEADITRVNPHALINSPARARRRA